MLNRIQAFRERGWQVIDAKAYAEAWARFGGSVATHPLVVEQLADLAQIPVRYLGWHQAGELKAAIPTGAPPCAVQGRAQACRQKGAVRPG